MSRKLIFYDINLNNLIIFEMSNRIIKKTKNKKLLKSFEVDPLLDVKGGFENKSCLIIGDGPSKALIDLNSKYDVDAIICIHKPDHKFVDYVCSLDIIKFNEKESRAIENNIPLILSSRLINNVPDRYWHGITFFKNRYCFSNSGIFAIEWAKFKSFKYIYTAGLDFYDPTKTQYIGPQCLKNINKLIQKWNDDINIYKIDSKSLLACTCTAPPFRRCKARGLKETTKMLDHI